MKTLTKAIVGGLILSLLLLPVVALAVEPPKLEPREYKDVTVKTVLDRVRLWLNYIAGTIAAIFLVIGGILYITAAGDQNRVAQAKGAMGSAIIGIVIIVLANIIISVIQAVLTKAP